MPATDDVAPPARRVVGVDETAASPSASRALTKSSTEWTTGVSSAGITLIEAENELATDRWRRDLNWRQRLGAW